MAVQQIEYVEMSEEPLPKYFISQANPNDRFSWRVYERQQGGWGAKPVVKGISKERAENMLDGLLSPSQGILSK